LGRGFFAHIAFSAGRKRWGECGYFGDTT